MARQPPSVTAILKEAARGGDRSSLFWFMAKHHDRLIQESVGKRMRWPALCATFLAHGLTDWRGNTATPVTARQTWLRVRKLVATTRARKATAEAAKPKKIYPSRLPVTWRPQLADVQPVTSSPSHISAAVAVGVVMDTPEAQAKIDRVFAELAERDKKKSGIFGDG